MADPEKGIEELYAENQRLTGELEAARHALAGLSDPTLEEWRKLLQRAETAEAEAAELKLRLGISSTVRNGNARCHTCGASLVTAVDEWKVAYEATERRIRQLEARVAELASESSANEVGYLHQCNKSAAFESEAEDLRRQLDAARHTLVGISDATFEDWQRLLQRAETAEARVRLLETHITVADHPDELFLCDAYDKAVADAVEAVPESLLRDWVALNVSKSGRLAVIARAEFARREARRRGE